jgi:DNA repair ATPase RecN
MKAKEEAEAEIEILQAEKQEAENMIASVDEEIHDGMEEIIDQKKALEEINQQLSEKKKNCKAYEEKIDKVLATKKPVDKEAKAIRSQAIVVNSVFGKEPVVKIPEQLFEKLMERYVAVGTMEQLSSSYEKKISSMQARIDKLNLGVKNLKSILQKYDQFLGARGLTKIFKEFARPKTLKEQLKEKSNIVEMKIDNEHKNIRERKDLLL